MGKLDGKIASPAEAAASDLPPQSEDKGPLLDKATSRISARVNR